MSVPVGTIVFLSALELVRDQHYGVQVKRGPSAQSPCTYQATKVWGIPPFNSEQIYLGIGRPAHTHPMNAHLELIELLHETEEFKALHSAVQRSLFHGEPFRVFCSSDACRRLLTVPEEIRFFNAIQSAVLEFWVLLPADQLSLPFVIARLVELQGPPRQLGTEPVGIRFQKRAPRSRPVFLEGYFRQSDDKAVAYAFQTLDAAPDFEREGAPAGAFHALVGAGRAHFATLNPVDISAVFSPYSTYVTFDTNQLLPKVSFF